MLRHNAVPAILILDIKGISMKKSKNITCSTAEALSETSSVSGCVDISAEVSAVSGDTNISEEIPLTSGDDKTLMAEFIKKTFTGAAIDVSLLNNLQISGEVVFNSEKLVGIKHNDTVYFINPGAIVSCI